MSTAKIFRYGTSEVVAEIEISPAPVGDALCFRSVDLSSRDMEVASFGGTVLVDADFRDSRLAHARFDSVAAEGVNFAVADLQSGHLSESTFMFTDFTETNLSRADLSFTVFSDCVLRDADLSGAKLYRTAFLDCPSLGKAKGLDTIRFVDNSYLDAKTLRGSIHELPDKFLQGVGYTPLEINNLRDIYGRGIEFYSCFLSYARTNGDFADRLHADLIQAGISCWQDVHDMRGGEFFREQIRDQIRLRDKIVIVCSEESLSRTNVVEEIVIGMEDERRSKGLKLFPIRIDDFIFSPSAERLWESLPANLRREDWLGYLRNYHVPDFSGWESHGKYKVAFDGLVRDLKAKG